MARPMANRWFALMARVWQGPGQMIYWVASREAALTLDPWFVPVDDAIVGLVDEVRNYPPEDLA